MFQKRQPSDEIILLVMDWIGLDWSDIEGWIGCFQEMWHTMEAD